MAGEPLIHKTFLLNALGLQIAASAFMKKRTDIYIYIHQGSRLY